MNGKLMILKNKKSHAFIDKSGENLSVKFLKKRMKKLNNELGFMSGYVLRLRGKINHNLRINSWEVNDRRQNPFTVSEKSVHSG